jgi:hypothetical protein
MEDKRKQEIYSTKATGEEALAEKTPAYAAPWSPAGERRSTVRIVDGGQLAIGKGSLYAASLRV